MSKHRPSILIVAGVAAVLSAAFATRAPATVLPDLTVAGDWVTTTSVAWERYTETWGFEEVGSGLLAQLIADAADPELSDSQLIERLQEHIEATLDPVTEGTPIGPGSIPAIIKDKLTEKVIESLREALADPDPHAYYGEFEYYDALYPLVSIKGHALVVKAGKHFVGAYREKEVHEMINDDGDTLVKRLYGVIDIKMFPDGVMFQAKGKPLSETGFPWTELAVRPEILPTKKQQKKGKKKRKDWTVETPHGLKAPLFEG